MLLDHSVVFYGSADLDVSFSESDDNLTLLKEVIYVGDFIKHGEKDLKFAVTEELIDHWVNTHSQLVKDGIEVPFPIEHNTDPEKRRGTVLALSKRNDSKGRVGLFASIKFISEAARDQLKNSQVSIYCPPLLKHQGKTYYRPIRHICATDYPVVTGLDPYTIAASYSSRNNVMMKALAEKMGLVVPPDASDEAIVGMIFARYEELMRTDVDGDGEVGENGSAPDGAPEEVAASNTPDPMMINLLRDNRMMKIDRLVTDRKITPARAKVLKDKFAGKTISFSSDGFDTIIDELSSNEPMIVLSNEASGRQLVASTESCLVKNAKSRSK